MSFADPLLLFRDREASEYFGASYRSGRDVQYATENIGDFKSYEAEGHVCKAFAFFREVLHVRVQICVVHVEGLVSG